MLRYTVFSDTYVHETLGPYRGWGIEARLPDGSCAGRVEDISEDCAYVQLVAAVLNRERAEPVHLRDILENFLSDPDTKNTLLALDLGLY